MEKLHLSLELKCIKIWEDVFIPFSISSNALMFGGFKVGSLARKKKDVVQETWKKKNKAVTDYKSTQGENEEEAAAHSYDEDIKNPLHWKIKQ